MIDPRMNHTRSSKTLLNIATTALRRIIIIIVTPPTARRRQLRRRPTGGGGGSLFWIVYPRWFATSTALLLLLLIFVTQSNSSSSSSNIIMTPTNTAAKHNAARILLSSVQAARRWGSFVTYFASSSSISTMTTTTTRAISRTSAFQSYHHHHYSRIRKACTFLSRQERTFLLPPPPPPFPRLVRPQQQQQQQHGDLSSRHHQVSLQRRRDMSFRHNNKLHASTPSSSSSSSSFHTESSSPLITRNSHDNVESASLTTSKSDADDTIFALSSGSSSSQATAVAVLRISGPQAANIMGQLLLLDSSEQDAMKTSAKKFPQPRVATLRTLYHPTTRQPLDQALILYFPGPRSFTGQDVVELHCHGSRAVTDSLLTVLGNMEEKKSSSTSSDHGSNDVDNHGDSSSTSTTYLARYAEPGEFTQRAFAAGKLDILQVEALADLLAADTSRQQQQALAQLEGQLSDIYTTWRQSLITALAHAEAIIDFGDDEHLGGADDELDDDNDGFSHEDIVLQQAQDNVWGGVVDSMQDLCQKMRGQLQDARRGELVRQGLQIAIVGPPNAGKSSLFNILSNQDVAIVSPTAGTTRDVLTVTLNLGGVKCLLQDTAGVRESQTATDDLIEREGMKRAIRVAAKADVVVAVVDDAFPPSTEQDNNTNNKPDSNVIIRNLLDEVILQNATLEPENVLLVKNKSDLRNSTTTASAAAIDAVAATAGSDSPLVVTGGERSFEISCRTQDGIDDFLDALTAKVLARVSSSSSSTGGEESDTEGSSSSPSSGNSLITRARHRQHVQAAVEALDRFLAQAAYGSTTVDLAAEELRLAASELGRITGAVDVEDVLDKLFADFCIGK